MDYSISLKFCTESLLTWYPKCCKSSRQKSQRLKSQCDTTCTQIRKTRNRGNCDCIATRGRPTPRQSSTALITMPCHDAKFELAAPIHCRIMAFLLLINYFTRSSSPLTFALEQKQTIKTVPRQSEGLYILSLSIIRYRTELIIIW